MNLFELLESLTGEEITPTWAQSFAEGPFERIYTLIEQLTLPYYEWIKAEITRRADNCKPVYHCFDPFQHNRGWDKWLTRFRQCLLYYPNVTVSDPLANVIWPIITTADLLVDYSMSDDSKTKVRRQISSALTALAEMAPLIRDNEFVLIPSPFIPDYEIVQSCVSKELKYLPYTHPQMYIERMYKTLNGHTDDSEITIEGVKLWGQVCALMDFTPVASSELTKEILDNEYEYGTLKCVEVEAPHSIIQDVVQYELPKLLSTNFRDVITLRRDEDVFNEWHLAFSKFIDIAQNISLKEEATFIAEVREAAETLLNPCVEKIEKRVKESVALGNILTPSALSIGTSAITVTIHQNVPTVQAVAQTGTSIDRIAGRLVKRLDKLGQEPNLVRDFYSFLLEN